MPAAESHDAPRPPGGPPFLRLNSWVYRVEMAAAAVAVLVALFYWRWATVGDLNVALTVFWLVWPDLLPFVPIVAVALARGSREWPPWGPALYNLTHTFLVWLGVFLIWSFLVGGIEWPLLGWAGHVAADRAFGFYLRARAGP